MKSMLTSCVRCRLLAGVSRSNFDAIYFCHRFFRRVRHHDPSAATKLFHSLAIILAQNCCVSTNLYCISLRSFVSYLSCCNYLHRWQLNKMHSIIELFISSRLWLGLCSFKLTELLSTSLNADGACLYTDVTQFSCNNTPTITISWRAS